jgi:hypothetical protein
MAVIESPTVAANLQEVGATTQMAAHVTHKPIPYGVLGHYRVAVRFALLAAQAANSRLFSLRNTGANLIVITRLNIRWLQTAAHTAAIEDSLDCFKLTGFTVDDTTNTVTPTVSRKKTTMGAAPGNVNIRNVTVAGATAGMTGGTLTKDGSPWAQLPKWLLLAVPTGSEVKADWLDGLDDVNGTHPFVFAQNEGFEVENRVLLGAAAGSSVYIDCCYAEVTAY